MELTEKIFLQLIEKTQDILRILKSSIETEESKEVIHLFEVRDTLLMSLDDNLRKIADVNKYRFLYESWQLKETELMNFVKSSLMDLDKKITEAQNARITSTQYDSYLRQMPYGAFLDKKR